MGGGREEERKLGENSFPLSHSMGTIPGRFPQARLLILGNTAGEAGRALRALPAVSPALPSGGSGSAAPFPGTTTANALLLPSASHGAFRSTAWKQPGVILIHFLPFYPFRWIVYNPPLPSPCSGCLCRSPSLGNRSVKPWKSTINLNADVPEWPAPVVLV